MRRMALFLPVLLFFIPAARAPAFPAEAHGDGTRHFAEPSAARMLAEVPLTFTDLGIGRTPYRTVAGAAQVGFGPGGVRMALHDTAGTSQSWGIHVTFRGARTVEPVAGGRTPGIVSFFQGPPQEWRTGLRTYASLRYEELWPGIDLDYVGGSGTLKYEFRVAAGADPEAIGLDWRGATVSPAAGGRLQIVTPAGTLFDGAPIAWQPGPDGRTPVGASWERRADGSWGFGLGSYDPNRPVVIDPEVVFSRFIGGSGNESGKDVAVDASGAVYVVGQTGTFGAAGNDFPAAVGPDTSYNGNNDAFVTKLTPGGTGVAYAGFIGGTDVDSGMGVAVDGAGAAYVTGNTSSDGLEAFPATVGPDLTLGGTSDVFVAKVRPDGTGLAYAGYVGGGAGESQPDVTVDGAGSAYVSGVTSSDQTTFPDTVGPDLTYNGGNDAFIAKVKSDGTGFAYAGYIGGSSIDFAGDVAVDGSGAAYVGGATSSDQTTFPDSVGPDTTYNGSNDAFIAKVKPDGTGLAYAGYIGGTDSDSATGVGVDGSGAAYVAGFTTSDQTAEGFPAAVGPDTSYAGPSGPNGPPDAFVAKVNTGGTGLGYAGYIGGDDFDYATGAAVDGAGAAYVTGDTASTQDEDAFPATGGPDPTLNGGTDGFVGKVLPSGTGLGYLGYVGGLKHEAMGGIAVDAAGTAYVTGDTNSNPATFPSQSGFSSVDREAFVVAVAEVCRGKVATIAGTGGKDTLTGTNGADVIAASGGRDTVNGKGGKDLICGGEGNDKLKGGGGKDRLYGEEGKDALIGQAGSDTCVGGPLKDRAKDCEKERQI